MKKGAFAVLAALALVLVYKPQALPVSAGAAIPAQEGRYVALTFDDGPRPGTTDRLLDGLRQRGASATFFVVGEQAASYPYLLERMRSEGHQVGNHTWGHIRLEGADTAALLADVQRMDGFLSRRLGPGCYWLRPPYGMLSGEVKERITVPMVTWSVDPRDWESRDTGKVVQAVLEAVRPNSIILLHDIYPTSVEAALQIVDALEAQGYEFVTVEELLRLGGVTPQGGVLYRQGGEGF